MSLIKRYFAKLKKDGITKTDAAKQFNMICGGKLRVQEISAMGTGKRKPNPCVKWLMLNATLLDTLEEFGFESTRTLSSAEYIELVDALIGGEK